MTTIQINRLIKLPEACEFCVRYRAERGEDFNVHFWSKLVVSKRSACHLLRRRNIKTLSPYSIVPIAFRSRNMIGYALPSSAPRSAAAGEQRMARNDDDLSVLDVLIVTALIGLTLGVGWKLWGSLFTS